MKNKISNFFILFKDRYGRQLFSIFKLLGLILLFIFAFKNLDINIFLSSIRALPIQNFLFYLIFIFLSKFLYAFRWQIVGRIVFPKEKLPLIKYLQTNLLAEFVSIVLPTSIGGEITRILKLSQKNLKASYVTASILIDRLLGIVGMVVVSVIALFLVGRKLTFNLKNIVPETMILPIIIGVVVILVPAFFLLLRWALQPKQTLRISHVWEILRGKFRILFLALGVTIIGHLVFSLAHSFLFSSLYPVSLIETIAIILTPQLARSIPVSVLGISAGEGLMVASLMMAGMSRETALIIIILSLIGRYFFAFSGFFWEFFNDGLSFFKQIKKNRPHELENEPDNKVA